MAVLKYKNSNGEYVAIPTGIPSQVSAFENDCNYQNEEQVSQAITEGLTGYYNKSEIDQTIQQYALKTELPDTTGFITMPEVEEKGYQTEEQVNALIEASGGSSSGIDTDLLNNILQFRSSINNPLTEPVVTNGSNIVNASACNVTDGGKFKECVGDYLSLTSTGEHKELFWDIDDATLKNTVYGNDSVSTAKLVAGVLGGGIVFRKNHTYKVHLVDITPLNNIYNTYGKETYIEYIKSIWGGKNGNYVRGNFAGTTMLFFYDFYNGIYVVEEIHRPEDIIDAKLAEIGVAEQGVY